MGLLFSNNATTKQKFLTCLIFLILGLSLTGMFSDILVDEEIGRPLSWLSIFTSTILIAYLEILLCIKSSSFRKGIEAQGNSLWKAALSVIFIIPLFIYPTICRGIPAAAHLFIATNDHIDVEIQKRASSYRSKTCDGGVYLQNYGLFLNDQICGIQEDHWGTLSAGDKLRLYGQKSIFGFTYEKYQILARH